MYGYDEAGNRVWESNRRGVKTTTTYDWGNRPTQVALSVDEERPGEYVAQGGELGVVGQLGVIARYGYDDVGNKEYAEDIHGHRTEYPLDALYRVVGEMGEEVAGAEWSGPPVRYEVRRRLNRVGDTVEEVDGNGHATRYSYDGLGRLTERVDALGRYERREYDGNGNVVGESFGIGEAQHLKRTHGYDGLNRPLGSRTEVAGLSRATYEESFQYDDVAHTVAARDGRGFVRLSRLDDLDRVYAETVDASHGLRAPDEALAGSPLGLQTQYEYDGQGQRSATIDALGRRTEEEYDGLGRLTQRRLPLGLKETFAYDGEGHILSHTDGRGITREKTWDVAGRVRQEKLLEGLSNAGQRLVTSETRYGDTVSQGLVWVKVKDAQGNTEVQYLDALHREVGRVDALGGASEKRYDFKNLRLSRNRKGQEEAREYDAVDRLLTQEEKGLDGATAYRQTWRYEDAARKVVHTSRSGVETEEERDGLGRVERSTRSGGGLKQVIGTEYNAAGQTIRLTDANGHIAEKHYDGAGRLVQEVAAVGTAEEAATRYSYDAVGNRVEVKGPRNTGVRFDVRESYDDLNRRVRSEDALGNVTARAYDALGNLLCEKQPLSKPALGHGEAGGKTLWVLSKICG